MKIIVRYCQQWANFTTKMIEILDDDTLVSLKKKVAEKFHLKTPRFFLKINKDGFNLRLCSNFPLSFYEFEEKAIVFLELIENSEEIQKTSEKRINQRYFEKLGLLTSVKEINEEEIEENFSGSPLNKSVMEFEPSFSKTTNVSLVRNYSLPNLQLDQEKSKLNCLIREVKKGNISEVKTFLENNELNLINTLGKCGWNPFHYAIFLQHQEISIMFINKEANLNLKTKDGWTPLQLSIYRNQQATFNKILSSNKVDIDLMGTRGTALHLSCRMNKPYYVNSLILAGADCNLKNSDGYMPVDLTTNQDIFALFKAKSDQRNSNNSKTSESKSQINFLNISLDARCPEKPPIVKGEMFKIGAVGITLNQRFFVLNAEEGTLIRFKKKEDFPLKPKEILPLKDIELIRKTEKPWYMSKSYYYFEIKYAGKRQTLACQYKSTMKLWIKYIYQAAIYSLQLESFLSKINKENVDENITKFVENCFVLSNSAAVELSDSPKDEDLILNKNLQCLQDNNVEKVKECRTFSTKSTTDNEQEKISFKSFQIMRILGSGAFGKVYLAQKKSTHAFYALKVLKKRQLVNKNQVRYAVSEANILKKMNHPFIINLYYTFQTPLHLYLALDYCPGKDLGLHLANHGIFTQEVAKFYISELILAIEYLHSLDIIYRDLKPENILLGQDGHIKLADFGLSKEGVSNDKFTMSFCGSPVYLSPEMLKNKGFSKKSDIYGIGLVLYEMITGNPPFYSDDIQVMYKMIMNGKVYYPKDMGKEVRNLLENILQKTPDTRFSLKEIKEHEFFNGLDWEGVYNKEYHPPKTDYEVSYSLKLDKHINFDDNDYTEENYEQGRFPNFSFICDKEKTVTSDY